MDTDARSLRMRVLQNICLALFGLLCFSVTASLLPNGWAGFSGQLGPIPLRLIQMIGITASIATILLGCLILSPAAQQGLAGPLGRWRAWMLRCFIVFLYCHIAWFLVLCGIYLFH